MKGICAICRKYKLIKRSLKLLMMICDACRKEDCSLCNRFKPVAVRTKKGRAICNSCFQRERYHDVTKHEVCCGCNNLKPVVSRTSKGPLCLACHLEKKVGECKKCNRMRCIKAGELCGACYEKKRKNKTLLRNRKLSCAR